MNQSQSSPLPRGESKPTLMTRRVSSRSGIQVTGVRYYSVELAKVTGKRVPVCLDPDNARRAFAFVRDEWVECRLTQYRTVSPSTFSRHRLRLAVARIRRWSKFLPPRLGRALDKGGV